METPLCGKERAVEGRGRGREKTYHVCDKFFKIEESKFFSVHRRDVSDTNFGFDTLRAALQRHSFFFSTSLHTCILLCIYSARITRSRDLSFSTLRMQEKRNKYVYSLISKRQKEGMEGVEGKGKEDADKKNRSEVPGFLVRETEGV